MSNLIGSIKKTVVRACINEQDLRMEGEFIAELENEVAKLLHAAIVRARGNGRKTLKTIDL